MRVVSSVLGGSHTFVVPMNWRGSHALGVHSPIHPSYAQRLELLVLQEEFSPRLRALRGSIQTLAAAGAGERPRGVRGHRLSPPSAAHSPRLLPVELMECEELHRILHLILSAGNHLNAVSAGAGAVPALL